MKPLGEMFSYTIKGDGEFDGYFDGRDIALMSPAEIVRLSCLRWRCCWGARCLSWRVPGVGRRCFRRARRCDLLKAWLSTWRWRRKSPIVEVKLNFRNANDGPWNYVYLDLEPSTRIEAAAPAGDGRSDIYPAAGLAGVFLHGEGRGGKRVRVAAAELAVHGYAVQLGVGCCRAAGAAVPRSAERPRGEICGVA